MTTWKVTYNKFVPEDESLREALCTLGNGYFGTRGAAPETMASKVHYPGTYIAGVYNTLPTEVAGRTIYNEDFVNCPNWLMMNYRIGNGPWYNRQRVKILSWKKELNMRKGMVTRRMRWQDDEGRTTLVEMEQIVSMSHPHCGAIRFTITPENYNEQITVRSGIDGLIINANVDRYKQLSSKHLEPCTSGSFGKDGIFLQMRTSQSNVEITEAIRTLVYENGVRKRARLKEIRHGRQRIMHEVTFRARKKERYTIEKLVSIYTSRDQGVSDNCSIAQDTISQVEDFNSLFKPHQAKWAALWNRFDIVVDGDPELQLALRLHVFHLLQSASTYNEDIDAGMPVRGLHGEAYRGHVFWDEMYVFPFYNLHAPEITRALLMYRYRRLAAAREYAKENGLKGAMFPWQSASTGQETTQIIHLNPMSGTWGPDFSSLQRHVSISIAYNVWTYYWTSGDRDFLDRYGAEMILEIASMWSSMAEYDTRKKKYVIKGVMGPDEFHEKYPGSEKGGLDNNAYTNVMVVWVLERALDILNHMMIEEDRRAIMLKTNVTEEDVKRWEDMSGKMYIPIGKDGIIHQFDGYMDLKELDWKEYRRKYDNIHRIDRILKAEGLSPDSYKVSKQADTLMMFYVLTFDEVKRIFTDCGYKLTKTMLKKNFQYYFQRTSHGSTLSMVVHAYICRKVGMKDQSMIYFRDALKSDLHDTQGGTTQEGIHTGVMGGTIDIFYRCFAGLNILEDRVSLSPDLPKSWKKIHFTIRFKSIWYVITITHKDMVVSAQPLENVTLHGAVKIPIQVHGREHSLTPGKKTRIKLTR